MRTDDVYEDMYKDIYGERPPQESPAGKYQKATFSAMCSLLDGHAYGLLLARAIFKKYAKTGGEEAARLVLSDLSDAPPDQRVSRMIMITIESLFDEQNAKILKELALKLLERLAVFMSPLSDETIQVCYESARRAMGDEELNKALEGGQEDLIRRLKEAHLLLTVTSSDEKESFTIHPIVRGYIYYHLHKATSQSLPNFTLPGFTSGTEAIYPGTREHSNVITGIFECIVDETKLALNKDETSKAVSLCRNAFSVMRSRMEANAAPRWCEYEKYVDIGITLADLVKQVSKEMSEEGTKPFWKYRERHEVQEVHRARAVLYSDELAWLYNDIGLTYCCMGDMPEAYSFWEQGFEINRIIDSPEEWGQYIVQSQLHMGHLFIDYGQLKVAEEYLRATERSNYDLKDPDYDGRITGYRALLEHLRANTEEADLLYKKALKKLRRAGGNPRAESKFLNHWASLKLVKHQHDKAEELIHSSRAIAEAHQHPDLVAFARQTNAHLLRVYENYEDARMEYAAALEKAREIGIRRLESDILSELGRLALELGHVETARQRAMESLQIANELGLGLRQTHCLVILGLVAIKAGTRELGRAYLNHAIKLAEVQGYWIRGHEAEKILQNL